MAILKNYRDIRLNTAIRDVPFTISISSVVDKLGINVFIVNNSNVPAVSYEYRVGASWETSVFKANISSPSYTLDSQAPGIYTIWCAAVDKLGLYSAPVSTSATISAPGYSSISYVIVGDSIKLIWTLSEDSSFTIDSYDLRYGTSWESGASTNVNIKSTAYIAKVTSVMLVNSQQTWRVKPKDINGNYGEERNILVNINVPNMPASGRTEVIDNNVLLYWDTAVVNGNQLPVKYYEVRKGLTWETSTLVGSNSDSTFTSIFEQLSGVFNYWVATVDTRDAKSAPLNIVATVSQPPDYVLRNDYNSDMLGGIEANITNIYGSLVGPINTTETWSTHFSSKGWTSPNSQILAGYPMYIAPGLSSASYTEIIDYGSAIPTTIATVTLGTSALVGVVTSVCNISYSNTSTSGPWTALPTGLSVLVPSFRYLKVVLDFNATAGNNLTIINSLNIKLAIKLRNDSGNSTYTVGTDDATGGKIVNFGYSFISADTPIVQPTATAGDPSLKVPLVIYEGTANPTYFKVKLYNISGTPVSGAFSWTVRGY